MQAMTAVPATPPIELVCPAGSLPALKIAVDEGADCVYLGFRDATNARNFAGLNFDDTTLAEGIAYAHQRQCKVLLALNTYPQPGGSEPWRSAIARAAAAGVDAVILADPGLMRYAAEHFPALRLHLSVQGSATNAEAINFYHRHFGIARAVLPRVLSVAQVEHVLANTAVEIEVFGFGSLCVMVEGRCALSSYVTGQAPNTHGVCSPASAVRWQQKPATLDARLGDVLIDSYAPHENASYPSLCKGRFEVADVTALRRLAANGRFTVEANDMGAVNLLAGVAPFVAGPHLNLYNGPALALLAELGARRWVMPLEMGRAGLALLARERPAQLETEVFVYGRMPLAFSARCFTARHRNLPKDDCQFSCLAHPDGLLMRTREQQPFLVLNGTQTQSDKVQNLVAELASMPALGVDVVRISPQAAHTAAIVDTFDAVRRGCLDGSDAVRTLAPWLPGAACNGYWHGKPGLDYTSAVAA